MPERATPGSLGRRVLLFGTLPGVLLLVAFGYFALGAARLEQGSVLVRHSSDINAAVGQILTAMRDAERGQRGFLLTSDEKYLAPYTHAVEAIPQAVARLQNLSAADPQMRIQVTNLQQAISVKLDELKQTIDVRRAQGAEAALAIVRTDAGERAMDNFERIANGIFANQQALLRDRFQTAAESERDLSFAASGGGLLALIVIGWITVALYRSYRASFASEGVLRATLDSVREGVSAFDANHRLVAWNQLFLQLLRLPPEIVRSGLTLDALETLKKARGDDAVAADLSELDVRARREGKPLLIERGRADGTFIELFQNPSPDGGFVTTYIDVTARRQAELAMRQAQKMESLGQMTGGIAHDFNNLLTIIVGNLDLLRGRLGDDKALLRHVDLALMGADRGAKLTHQLLAFARRQPLEPKPVNLAQLLPDLTEMLRRSLGELIEVEVVGTGGLWNTLIDPHQFETAVLNLAINARDAMTGGGRLTLELANVWLDDAYAARHEEVQPGQYVMFGVTDTGAGMPPEVAARAFDPFFSTKGDSGTGLGLSMVFGFVKQSGGHIKIYSEPGHGTTVKLYLPRSVDAKTAALERPVGGQISGSETILVVEDDDTVRSTVVDLLGGLGYRILEATNGASALTVLESGESIDLLFTDVIMPGSVSTRVLAERARELRPGMKILFTSGYTENTIVHNGRLDSGVQLISKPYGREQLAQKIRGVLTRPDPLAKPVAGDGAS